ncbi:Protein TraB [Paraburkholderia aspalathi]|uniref:Protein TraB n=1 Tax=Paraburkholderia aspalathi TaxID=1324617 RepID=A0ABM8SPG3_9BURK|nr:KfrB domain-containing protein [Paraburkholderia aspalathi]MBK3822265.1 conjugal transfer protein TraB [Paraburkholderia aspalathi]MBK3834075.1 conjugal transfer protein TraB [Paraburkholderia aspalathi]MBK3863823.1 conjugal transfer protein TraB [Paraburkholderia aspalathi]CAE6824249.1 Protein TraB [Paraburkholderia aspalathi]
MQKNRTSAEGDTKISVNNGSRNIDRFSEGQWLTMKSLPDAGLPHGVYHLADAAKAAKNVHPQTFGGQVVHVDQSSVYQLSGKDIVQHERGLFAKEPVVGQCYEVSYRRGIGTVKGELSLAEGAKLDHQRSRSL